MRRNCAFTLVELLVVVAIISLLTALLAPSLRRVRELTRRTVCLTNMGHTIQGCMSYASEARDMLPPSQSSDATLQAYAYDAKNAGVAQNGGSALLPLGVGLLVPFGHLPSGQLGAMLHCPSLDTSGAHQWNTPYHCMDVNTPNHWNGMGASWWSDPAYATRRIVTSYNYRSPSYWRANGRLQMRSTIVRANTVLYVDVIDPRFGGRYGHKEGHNAVSAHGGGGFREVPEDEIEAIAMADGNPFSGGLADWPSDEAIFELFED